MSRQAMNNWVLRVAEDWLKAERSVKPFVMGWKNWLFANTEDGTQSSSMIYSLIETAKENGLDPLPLFRSCADGSPQAGSRGQLLGGETSARIRKGGML